MGDAEDGGDGAGGEGAEGSWAGGDGREVGPGTSSASKPPLSNTAPPRRRSGSLGGMSYGTATQVRCGLSAAFNAPFCSLLRALPVTTHSTRPPASHAHPSLL
jgi:hypothetical protein